MKTCLTAFLILVLDICANCQITDFDSVNFDAIDSMVVIYDGVDLKDQEKLVALLTKDLNSDIKKFRAIFKWVTNNISYDVELMDERNEKEYLLKNNKRKLEKWRTHFQRKLLRKLTAEKSSICFGYSTLLQSRCALTGIRCEVVEGYGRTSDARIGSGKTDHAWNAVNLYNKWYLCDPTWASGGVDQDLRKFRKQFKNSYFLTEPSLLIANHYPKNAFWALLREKPTLTDFLTAPIKASGYISNKINRYKPEQGSIKLTAADTTVRFSFTSNLPNEKIGSAYVEIRKLSGRSYKFYLDEDYLLQQDPEGFWYFQCGFPKGRFRIHIYLERRLSFVYEVNR